MITRKDIKDIARILIDYRNTIASVEDYRTKADLLDGFYRLTDITCYALRNNNPRFDTERFVRFIDEN